MRKTQFILLMAVLTSPMLRAEGASYSARLVCSVGPSTFLPLNLSSFNFSATQFTDPNTGSLTGKVTSSLRFELPFGDDYKVLLAAVSSNQKFSTCNLYLMRGSGPLAPYARWLITNAMLTDLSAEGEEGSGGSTNVVGTLTFATSELINP